MSCEKRGSDDYLNWIFYEGTAELSVSRDWNITAEECGPKAQVHRDLQNQHPERKHAINNGRVLMGKKKQGAGGV